MHAAQAFCKYLECGIFVRGFARARYDDFDQEFLVAFIHRFGRSPNTHVHLERTGKRWLLFQLNSIPPREDLKPEFVLLIRPYEV